MSNNFGLPRFDFSDILKECYIKTTKMGQASSTVNFYRYGKQHFTALGYAKHVAEYVRPNPKELEEKYYQKVAVDKVFLVTGANSGIGKEVTKRLVDNGATVYMVCRNLERCETAIDDIVKELETKKEAEDHPKKTIRERLKFVIGDVALKKDVHSIAEEVMKNESSINGIVCNAGGLGRNEMKVTTEGVEETFACHLLFGTHLLSNLLLGLLKGSIPHGTSDPIYQPRVVAITSGGMYNHKFPSWGIATNGTLVEEETPSKQIVKYDGQMAYVYAKRGQVIWCEEMAKMHPNVLFLSAHPGWTTTPGVDKAYSESEQKWIQPLRSVEEGAEGIVHLLLQAQKPLEDVDDENFCYPPLVNGALYLDRKVEPKHLDGMFSGSTKNSEQERKEIMQLLEKHSK